MDARNSVDIWGGNGSVFGLGLANTGVGRDQEQTQINSNERTNDGHEHRDIGADVYDTCAGSETNRSPLPLWQINEQGEASAYIKAHAGDGLHQCEGNPVYQLRFQARSESQRGANGIVIKDEAIECEVVEQGGLNLGGISAVNLPAIATCSDKKRKAAFKKYDVIKAWEDAKGKIGEAAFLEYINARKICCVKVTANKLYDWQRKYKRGGLDALVDERDNNKTLKLEELGLAQLCVELILACKGMGKVDITNIYRSLNYHAIKNSLINFEDFQGKKDEVVSYEVVNRFVNNYLNKNKLVKNIILYGEDGAVGRGLPALGISNYAVSTINEVVEIDGSPLDLICNASELCDLIGWQNVSAVFKDKDEFENYVKEWQKRYTIIALIDTYSGVATFHISETENSLAIARAVAKYIVRYGKPKVIKGDNGKAFKSEYMREVLGALEIEYKAVRAYSGWLKPYVERNFRALQHSFSANLAGFIGHNISQRQAIEFFRSKKERRLKRGYKTNLTMLKNLNEVQELMDMYAEKFLNTRYLERLGTTCAAAYSAKVGDAVYMNAIRISARLSKRELKHVHKKGVSIDNVWYYNLAMFAHERVFVNQNVNNINECFVWSENNEFIGVASTLDLELGVSAEEARTTQKLFNKRLKETKKQMDEALTAHQASFEQTVRLAEAKPAALPKPQAVNNEAAIIDAALKEAKNLNSNAPLEGEILSAAGSDVSPKRAKKIKGWMEIGCARA
ncbi:Mu transposase C-terminal domain-containing protein [Campylobacter rectus]|uniref:Mu transposase C-terminal domain-containing protein n=1 Tax=Campylobacter rectus TaxID=203 RepID=UPI001639CF2C|nr:Mu transposase C-terminal domain-containing protein [Campylobacter rectus]